MGRRSRRKWCYAQPPATYAIGPCKCGNSELQWSEWKGYVWCNKCSLDFIPTHNGIFDGPIPLGAANLMGIHFDRIDLYTQKIIKETEWLQIPTL